jgi:AcrR family transcriptional regulator
MSVSHIRGKLMPKIIENVKDLIIEKAYTLFIKEGYDQVKTSRIAKECNIAAGTLFNYFPTKWDLLREILTKISKKSYDEILEKLKESCSSYDLVNHLVDDLYYVIERTGKLSKDFFAFMLTQDGCEEVQKTKSQQADEEKALVLLKKCFPQLKGQSNEVVWLATRSLASMVIATYCHNGKILERRKKFVCESFLAMLENLENNKVKLQEVQ